MPTSIWLDPPTPGGVTHSIVDCDCHVADEHGTCPSFTAELLAAASPKLLPKTVTCVPPIVGPLLGASAVTCERDAACPVSTG